MRTARVAARAGQVDVETVAGGGDRPAAHTDEADVDARIAVQRVDRVEAGHRPGGDRAHGAARDHLLGRLEDQPDAPGQVHRREDAGHPEQDRGVRVVPAGMTRARGARAVRDVLEVGQRQRVDVGTQRDHSLALADVADDAGAAGQHGRRQSEHPQPLGDQVGRALLGEAELGMCMQVAADRDQLGLVRSEPVVENPHRARPSRISAISESTTAVRSPLLAAATARWRW